MFMPKECVLKGRDVLFKKLCVALMNFEASLIVTEPGFQGQDCGKICSGPSVNYTGS